MGLLLVCVLGLLLALQSSWLGELAEARREETQRTLQTAADNIVREFQATLADLDDSVRKLGAAFEEAPKINKPNKADQDDASQRPC